METIKIGETPLSVRGHTSVGTVVSDRMKKTVVVEKDALQYIAKYKRYARRKSRIPAHNPEGLKAKVGDLVRIAECRKISKTVAWTVVEILSRKGEEANKKKKTQ
ncbi:MAG TPA: 30S ribosomal protein S17 [Candidatus Micrarchaeota archaeon]|nr:30S ribosomal protein S17 [Candidatus Micrarchaeota archaeon]